MPRSLCIQHRCRLVHTVTHTRFCTTFTVFYLPVPVWLDCLPDSPPLPGCSATFTHHTTRTVPVWIAVVTCGCYVHTLRLFTHGYHAFVLACCGYLRLLVTPRLFSRLVGCGYVTVVVPCPVTVPFARYGLVGLPHIHGSHTLLPTGYTPCVTLLRAGYLVALFGYTLHTTPTRIYAFTFAVCRLPFAVTFTLHALRYLTTAVTFNVRYTPVAVHATHGSAFDFHTGSSRSVALRARLRLDYGLHVCSLPFYAPVYAQFPFHGYAVAARLRSFTVTVYATRYAARLRWLHAALPLVYWLRTRCRVACAPFRLPHTFTVGLYYIATRLRLPHHATVTPHFGSF